MFYNSMNSRRETAGEKANRALLDRTKYDPMEVSAAINDDVVEQLMICARSHESIFDEDKFCVVLLWVGDPLIVNLRRHKYYGWPYLPDPRPQQSVFLYRKDKGNLRRLWTLPSAKVMANVSEVTHQKYLGSRWRETKIWCDVWFDDMMKNKRNFHPLIRKMHNIDIPSEHEYLKFMSQKLIQAGCQKTETRVPEPFDFSKVQFKNVKDPRTSRSD